jgi:hypothetical protein
VVSIEVVVEEVLAERGVDVGLSREVRVGLVVRPEGLVECEGFLVVDLPVVLGVAWIDLGREQARLLRLGDHANDAFRLLLDVWIEVSACQSRQHGKQDSWAHTSLDELPDSHHDLHICVTVRRARPVHHLHGGLDAPQVRGRSGAVVVLRGRRPFRHYCVL